MTLDVKPEIAAALEALASAQGLSVEDYLEQLVEKQLPIKLEDAARSEGSGMVWETGYLSTVPAGPCHCAESMMLSAKSANKGARTSWGSYLEAVLRPLCSASCLLLSPS